MKGLDSLRPLVLRQHMNELRKMKAKLSNVSVIFKSSEALF